MSICAVICDLFDVLFCDDNLNERQAYEKQLGLSCDAIKQSMLHSPQFREALAGRVSETELWQDVALTLHLDASESLIVAEKFYSAVRLNSDLLAFLRLLRPRYKTAILSNAPSTVRDLATQHFHLDQDVDEIILSAEVNLMKPSPDIYRLAASMLGVLPHEVIYIDDETRFTNGAQAVGMQAIQFKDTQQTIMDIQQLLSLHTS